MKFGEAYCDQKLADEVRQGEIRRNEKEQEEKKYIYNIKSNNSHLTGKK